MTHGLEVLSRLRGSAGPSSAERCDLCGEAVPSAHGHVVDLDDRALRCTCRACYLLFTGEVGQQPVGQLRAIPQRYVSFPDFRITAQQWEDLQVPVSTLFVLAHSRRDSLVVLYPGPAGATESDLPLDGWQRLVEANPGLAALEPDVEAVLMHVPAEAESAECFLVPVDACYQLVGTLRTRWRGFDGGREAREAVDEFFAQVRRQARP